MKKADDTRAVPQLGRRAVLFVYDVVSTLIIAMIVFSIIFTYFFRLIGVDGSSMLPTLKDGDLLVLSMTDDAYHRGDIIVVHRPNEDPLIKRVIAIGGERITIDDDGNVYINDRLLNEKYIQGETVMRDFDGTMLIPRGYLFVMGDNRTVSNDSRRDEVGLIAVEDVVGKAVYRVWPFRSIGKV